MFMNDYLLVYSKYGNIGIIIYLYGADIYKYHNNMLNISMHITINLYSLDVLI